MKNILSFLVGGIGVIFFLGFAIVQGARLVKRKT